MRSLDILTYYNILKKQDKKVTQNAIESSEWMKEWDEVRTQINPKAKWYDEEEEKDKFSGENKKD